MMLDSARCLENRAYYRRFIEFAAARGINVLLWHFTDDQGCSMLFDVEPGIASPHAYSRVEMRELIAFARSHGIELVPELASLGHCHYLTKLPAYQDLNEGDGKFTGMCPVSDRTRRIVKALIEETAAVFDSPNFHVGLDEVNIGAHPLTREAMLTKTKGQVLADYVNFVHGVVTNLGKRMWMWGDGLLKHPEMLQQVPRDVVICNWQYTPHASPKTTHTLLDAGFDVMLCSAMISYDQTLFPGNQFAIPNIRTLQGQLSLTGRGKILGHLTTIWTGVRYIADSMWLGVDLTAAILRDGPAVDADAQAARFARDFYGLSAVEASHFAEVSKLLLDASPTRAQWVDVAKLKPLKPDELDKVAKLAPRWARASKTLSDLAPAVRQHATEFEAFALLIEMLACTYEAAARAAGGELPPATTARLISRGDDIAHRVAAAWDRERFADDPRKFTAPLPAFQDDHLVALIAEGVDALKHRNLAAPELTPAGGALMADRSMNNIIGSNHKTAAAWNRGLAISLLRRHGTLSRYELSKMTQLQGSTLSYIVRELLEKNVVRVVGKRQTTQVGQKQVLLTLNPNLGWMMGVGVRPGTASLMLMNAAGEKIDSTQVAVTGSMEALPEQLHAALTGWLERRGVPGGKMLGLGVGVPGVVDSDSGVVLRSNAMPAVSVPLQKLLVDRFQVTTVIDHDASFAACAEATDGAAADVSHFVFFSVSTTPGEGGYTQLSAFGTALYLQGQIYRGAFYGAGELTDSLEPATLNLNDTELADLANVDGPLPPLLVELAAHMGRAIGTIINLIDVQLVVLGGTARIANQNFINEVQQIVARRLVAIPGRTVRVVTGHWKSDANARGAAISAFDAVVARGELVSQAPGQRAASAFADSFAPAS